MASHEEDDDLAALKMAVLATMKNKTEKAKAEEQALATSVTKPEPLLGPNNHPQHLHTGMGNMPQFHRGRGHGRGRSRGRGRGMGSMMMGGRGGMVMGGRGGRTNLIVLTAAPEPKTLNKPTNAMMPHHEMDKETSKKLLILPQDRWAPSSSADNNSDEPHKPKGSTKFSRYESDSDSEDEEDVKDSDSDNSDDGDGDIKVYSEDVELNTYSDDSDTEQPRISDNSDNEKENVNSRSSSRASSTTSQKQSPCPSTKVDKVDLPNSNSSSKVTSPARRESSDSSTSASISPIRSKSPSPAPVTATRRRSSSPEQRSKVEASLEKPKESASSSALLSPKRPDREPPSAEYSKEYQMCHKIETSPHRVDSHRRGPSSNIDRSPTRREQSGRNDVSSNYIKSRNDYSPQGRIVSPQRRDVSPRRNYYSSYRDPSPIGRYHSPPSRVYSPNRSQSPYQQEQSLQRKQYSKVDSDRRRDLSPARRDSPIKTRDDKGSYTRPPGQPYRDPNAYKQRDFDEYDARNYRDIERDGAKPGDRYKERVRYDEKDRTSSQDRSQPFSSYKDQAVGSDRDGSRNYVQRERDSRQNPGRPNPKRSQVHVDNQVKRESRREKFGTTEASKRVHERSERTGLKTSKLQAPSKDNVPLSANSDNSDSDSGSSSSVELSAGDKFLDDSESDDSTAQRGKTISERAAQDIETERRKRTIAEMEKEREERRVQREKERQMVEEQRKKQMNEEKKRRDEMKRDSKEKKYNLSRYEPSQTNIRAAAVDKDNVVNRNSFESVSEDSDSIEPPAKSLVSVVSAKPKAVLEPLGSNTSVKRKKHKKKKKKRDVSSFQGDSKRIIVKSEEDGLPKPSVFKRLKRQEDAEFEQSSEPTINITFQQEAERLPVHKRLGLPVQSRIGKKAERNKSKQSTVQNIVRVVHKEEKPPKIDLRNILQKKSVEKRKGGDITYPDEEIEETSYSSKGRQSTKRIRLNRKGGSGDASSTIVKADVKSMDGSVGEETELDMRIRKIQEKNAAILQRKREIEADKQRYAK